MRKKQKEVKKVRDNTFLEILPERSIFQAKNSGKCFTGNVIPKRRDCFNRNCWRQSMSKPLLSVTDLLRIKAENRRSQEKMGSEKVWQKSQNPIGCKPEECLSVQAFNWFSLCPGKTRIYFARTRTVIHTVRPYVYWCTGSSLPPAEREGKEGKGKR